MLILWLGSEPALNASWVYCKPCDSHHFTAQDHPSEEMHMCDRHRDCPLPGLMFLSLDFLQILDSYASHICVLYVFVFTHIVLWLSIQCIG